MAIATVPPLIAAQLNYLVSNCPFAVKVDKMWSGCKDPNLLDRFALVIPYCLDCIRWDVLFNAAYPLAAPDVIFEPEDESFQPYVNSLVSWNSKDPANLLSLIMELRDAYVAYHGRRIEGINDDRLKFEISTMPSRQGIEMYTSSLLAKPQEVKFVVPLLDMDLNKFVAGSTSRQQKKIRLQVVYPVGKKTAAPRLKLIPSSELKALFSVEEFRLPPWLDGMCIAEYLTILEQTLESQIKEAISLIELRRKFIMALAAVFGRPVEADPVFCRRATFLASSGVFTFLVHMSIPLHYPKLQPALLMQSSQHFNSSGIPIKSHVLTDYPWSPRWEASEKALRIFDFVADECLNFKKYCSQLNPQ